MSERTTHRWPGIAGLLAALTAGCGSADPGGAPLPATTPAVAPSTNPTTGPVARPRPYTLPDRPFARRALIVTVDGLRPDLLAVAEAPNLRGLALAGSYTFWARTVDDPYVYTLPAHVSILTGVHPDRHGVTWNEYIEQSYPQVPTLFDLAKRRGMSTALVSGKMKFVAAADPASLDWRYLPPDEPVADADVADRVAKLVAAHRPDVLFVHLPGVDTAGHERGWGSPQQRAAVAAADAAVGRVLAAYRDAGLLRETLVLVTADHGGTDVLHYNGDPRSRTVPWIATGPGVRAGADLTLVRGLDVRSEDTFATACAAVGIPIPAGSDGRFVEEILEGRDLLRPAADTRAATRPGD